MRNVLNTRKRKLALLAAIPILLLGGMAAAQIFIQATVSNTVTVSPYFNVDAASGVNGIYYNPQIVTGQTSFNGAGPSGVACTAVQSGGLTTITCPNPNAGTLYAGDTYAYSVDVEAAKVGIIPKITVSATGGFTVASTGNPDALNSTYYQTNSVEGLGGTAGNIIAGLPATMAVGQWYFFYVVIVLGPTGSDTTTAPSGPVTFTANLGTSNA